MILRSLIATLLFGLFVSGNSSAASCLSGEMLRGVNWSGGEFSSGTIPGVLGTDYYYPSNSDLQQAVDNGFSLIRVPIKWARVVEDTSGYTFIDEAETSLKRIADFAKSSDICVVLDIHDFGHVDGTPIPDLGQERQLLNFVKFLSYKTRTGDMTTDDIEHVAIGIMNEPKYFTKDGVDTWEQWSDSYLVSLRNSNVRNVLLISGKEWSNISTYDGWADKWVTGDPYGRTYVELHQYFDENQSGAYEDGLDTECVNRRFRLDELADRYSETGMKFFIGEFGAPENKSCLNALKYFADKLEEKQSAFFGYALWSMDKWNGSNYLLQVRESDSRTNLQVDILRSSWARGD